MNRYINIPQTKIKGNVVYKTVRYPEVPLSSEDIYVYTQQGDRFDILARQYYQDSSLWWVIAISNPQITLGSLLIPSGLQLRIPAFPSDVVNEYKTINK
jgi:hypothetical protein